MSLSSWRAWIEISRLSQSYIPSASRSPHGERGLKLTAQGAYPVGASRSPHGERGLKLTYTGKARQMPCRSPHGERGLKFPITILPGNHFAGRSPHGERGLKYSNYVTGSDSSTVALLMESVD